MAVTSKLYGNFLLQCFNKENDLDTDDLRTSLHTVTYVPNQDTNDYWDDATNEVSGTGYSTPGYAHATQTLTYTAGTDIVDLAIDDATWATSTITARVAVTYNNTPALATAKGLIAYHLSDADISTTSGTFTVDYGASLFTIDVS